jgi:hypothetical protein
MERNEIARIWIEYLNESNFKRENGEQKYRDYVARINAYSKAKEIITTWPTVTPLSEVIEKIIDRTHAEIGNDDLEVFKKKLVYNIALQEQTNLMLFIHAPSIPAREGQENVLQKVRALLRAKMKNINSLREFYSAWTEPGDRIVPELALYLELYRGRRKGFNDRKMREIIKQFTKKSDDAETKYLDESAVNRVVAQARRIILNVEKGVFPGNYRSL